MNIENNNYSTPLLNSAGEESSSGELPPFQALAPQTSTDVRESYLQTGVLNPASKDLEPPPRQIPFTKYFTYLTTNDKILLGAGTAAAILAGAILPSISLVMGNVAVAFSGGSSSSSNVNILSQMSLIASIVMLIALALFVFSYMFFAFWQHLAENITTDLRKRYIAALMHQEIAYFEINKVEQIPAQIAEIFDTVQASIGEKIANLIFAISTCISGIVYAMVFGVTFASACVAYLPILLIIIGTFGMQVRKSVGDKLDVVKQLGGIAEETLTAIKVVTSFGREQRELDKFTYWSQKTREVAGIQSTTYAKMVGLMKFSIFFFYSYALYVGSWFIENGVYNLNSGQAYNQQIVIQTLIALITGFVGLIAALPNIQAIVAAKTLGVLIFDVIERVPEVKNDPNPKDSFTLAQSINFNKVTFKYPTSLPEHKPVLIDASFSIKAGEATAIVGPSGSGKSTIVQLIERFYDPKEGGSVDFDGQDLKKISLKSLRESIGYVSQEPVMIMGTIRDNLLYGNKDATEQECIDALKQANAAFVQEQENGLDTFVGTAGIMNMSGGQKQRIAIARALIKKPKILILDEATSALDPKSEIEVQGAIDQIARSSAKLTIIIIAHRLTTIASADNLLFFKSRTELVSAAKGTPEYNEIFEKLKSISYAQGEDVYEEDDEEEENQLDELDGIEEDHDEDNDSSHDAKSNSKNNYKRESLNADDLQFTRENLSGHHTSLNGEDDERDSAYRNRKSASFRVQTQVANSIQLNPAESLLNPMSQKQMPVSQPLSGKMIAHLSPKNYNTKRVVSMTSQKQRTQSMKSTSSISPSELENFIGVEDMDKVAEYREVTYSEIMKDYKPTSLAVAGFIFSTIASLQLPLFGLVLSKYIFILALPGLTACITPGQTTSACYDQTIYNQKRNMMTIYFVILCFGIGSSTFLQKYYFGRGGENLTFTLRVKLFAAILRKNIGWFDNKNRAPGILTNIITEDISAVNGLTTESVGIAVEAGLGLFFSCLICFIFAWQLAIIVTITSPFMVLGGLGISKLQFNQKAVDDSYKQANALLNDIIMNYRTVVSFGEKNLQFILNRYSDLLIVPHLANIKRAHISGLFFGYSQSIRFIFIAFVFYVAAVFIQRFNLNSQSVFTGCYVVFVGAIGSGVSISQMPSVSKAKQAARTVFGIIEEPSTIDPKQSGNIVDLHGCIEFRNIFFRYPSRRRYVLRKFNLRIEPNQSVAIVGHSGSGKSTIASLLLRFYDVSKGSVVIDGVDIRDHDLERLRNQISIVQQEPMLFNETIISNIKFGDLVASDARVLEVAIQANALAFIMQNDEDYTNPMIQLKITELFAKVSAGIDAVSFPRLKQCLVLARKQTIDFRQLMFICQLLPFLTPEGLQEVENRFDDILLALKSQIVKQDCTWLKIMKAFEFQPEIKKIEQFFMSRVEIEEVNTQEIPEDVRKEIFTCINQNECEFDLQTVVSFCKTIKSRKTASGTQKLFSVFLKADRARVETFYRERFNSFVNQLRVKTSENELDIGFLKICGLKGSKLSGGQKQRIAIARALIKSPKIIILDEATSALDEQSQEIVQQALDRAMEGRTCVVIAHRMTTIKKCSRIVVLHKGAVVEDGTYEELSQKKDGHFARLEAGVA